MNPVFHISVDGSEIMLDNVSFDRYIIMMYYKVVITNCKLFELKILITPVVQELIFAQRLNW